MKITLPLYPRPNTFNSNGYLIPKIPLDIALNKFMETKYRHVTIESLDAHEDIHNHNVLGFIESIDMSGDTYMVTANLADPQFNLIINECVFGIQMYANIVSLANIQIPIISHIGAFQLLDASHVIRN